MPRRRRRHSLCPGHLATGETGVIFSIASLLQRRDFMFELFVTMLYGDQGGFGLPPDALLRLLESSSRFALVKLLLNHFLSFQVSDGICFRCALVAISATLLAFCSVARDVIRHRDARLSCGIAESDLSSWVLVFVLVCVCRVMCVSTKLSCCRHTAPQEASECSSAEEYHFAKHILAAKRLSYVVLCCDPHQVESCKAAQGFIWRRALNMRSEEEAHWQTTHHTPTTDGRLGRDSNYRNSANIVVK
jgi:hypothetical protein